MKKIITLMTTILFVFVMSTVAFAAGWTETKDGWKYEKKDGDFASYEWKKSGDSWFFLQDDELMAINKVVEYDDNFYCVDQTGRMITNSWAWVAKDSDEESHWMYFQNNGKAIKEGKKTIGVNEYHFTDCIMDFGWFDENWSKIDDNEDYPYAGATYYLGEESDGHIAKNTWVKIINTNDEESWVFFGSNGKKVTGKKIINGVEYFFEADGNMKVEFVSTPSEIASPGSITKYFREDGSVVKNGWIWAMDEEENDYHWYYAKGNGELLKGIVKEIGGKKYSFNSKGEMLTGFVAVNDDKTVAIEEGVAADSIKLEDLYTADHNYMYFTENQDPMLQGSAKAGKTTIEVDGVDVVINFTSYGIAKAEGYKEIKGYLYQNSILVKDYEEDCDYKYIEVKFNEGSKYLTAKTGKLVKNAPKKAEDLAPWFIDARDN